MILTDNPIFDNPIFDRFFQKMRSGRLIEIESSNNDHTILEDCILSLQRLEDFSQDLKFWTLPFSTIRNQPNISKYSSSHRIY